MLDTTSHAYDTAGGTIAPAPEPVDPISVPEGLRAWFESDAAQSYGGLWVALDADLGVVDSDLSPGALKDRLQDGQELIVYVENRSELNP